MIATGSRNALKPGIRLESRWLSKIFTTPMVAAPSSAALAQFTYNVLSFGIKDAIVDYTMLVQIKSLLSVVVRQPFCNGRIFNRRSSFVFGNGASVCRRLLHKKGEALPRDGTLWIASHQIALQ